MQPLVHATTRTPGPSTVEPVVNECRNPMSPVARAVRTSDSARAWPGLTRRSNGLCASSWPSSTPASPVERPVDDVHLLLPRQADEVDRITGDADGQARILLRVVDSV